MRITTCLLFCLVIAALSDASLAQEVPPAPVATPPPKIEGQPMPLPDFQDIALHDLLDEVHHRMPEFNSIVVRGANVIADYPKLPKVSLNNVTIGQFLEFIRKSYPDITVERVDGPTPLYIFRITAAQNQGGWAQQMEQQAEETMRNSVQIYKLTAIVNALSETKGGPAEQRTKQSLNDVLSLVQAAMEQAGADKPPLLKVHEPTLTFMFKGSSQQRYILEQILNALTPTPDDTLAKAQANQRTMQQKYEYQFQLEKDRNDMLRQELEKARTEQSEMRKAVADQLARMQQSTTKP